MSAATQQPAAPPERAGTRPTGSLLRSELLRFRSRRFIQVLLGLAVLGWLGAIGIGLLVFETPTAADYAVAQQNYEQALRDEAEWYDDCVAQAEGEGQSPEQFCGPRMQDSGMEVENFLEVQPFDMGEDAGFGAMAFAAGAAVLAFLVGATWIGAEWSTRSLVALLFWVPGRLKVMGTKLGVLVLAAAAIGVVAQLCWLVMASVLDAVAGTDRALPEGFWGDLLAEQGRAVLLAVLVALIGFGLANLTRSTGAALGIAFVWFAIVENAVRVFWGPLSDRWLLTLNATSLVAPGGTRIYDYDAQYSGTEPPSHLVTNLAGGSVVAVYAAVIVGIGVWLFARRDLH